MDKKSDKKIDADELLIVMKELGWAVPVLACTPQSLAECARRPRHRHKCSKADADAYIAKVSRVKKAWVLRVCFCLITAI